MTTAPQKSKYERAMEKRRSKLRRTVASARDWENVEENDKEIPVMNTDEKMHAKNNLYRKLCVLCNAKVKMFLVPHYAKQHPEHEVFISRPSPEMADKLRLQKFRSQITNNKISGFCYFCEEVIGQ